MSFFSTIPASATLRGLTAVGYFLLFCACMASLAGAALALPNPSLSRICAQHYLPMVYAFYGPTAMLALLLIRETRDVRLEDLDASTANSDLKPRRSLRVREPKTQYPASQYRVALFGLNQAASSFFRGTFLGARAG